MHLSTAHPSNSFNFDIFEIIINIVAEERDLKTLKSLSLVQSDLQDICQRHLFSNIVLRDSPLVLKTLVKVLEGNTGLALYAKNLEILVFSELLLTTFELLSKLPCLQELKLTFFRT